jgi:signal transduction histidine kinase
VAALSAVEAGASPALEARVTGDTEVRASISDEALKQILLNLVQNARDAMEGSGSVEMRVSSHNGVVVVDVLDQGPGIPDGDLPRIFDPFYSTKEEVRGVGLGLFTAEGLVRGAGGRITGRNREDGPGAWFRIELPAWDAADGAGEAKAAEARS